MPPDFDHAAYCAEISQRMTEYTEREIERAKAEARAKDDIAAANAAYVFQAAADMRRA